MKSSMPTKNTKTKKDAQYWLFLRRSMNAKKILVLATLFLGISLFVQCKKDKNILGTDVQPKDDQLNANVESYSVFAHSKRYDSILSLNVNQKFIGSNLDPNFGLMDVGLYLNANMDVSNVSFSDSTELVSAEIILEVSNYNIGKQGDLITYSVFPLDSQLIHTRAYYTTNNRLHNKNKVIGNHSTSFSTYNQRNVIRIPIDINYAKEIFENTQALSSNAAFQSIYKGFYIQAASGFSEGNIYICNLETDNSGFYLRYKKGASPSDTAFRFRFFGTNAARFNTVNFQPLPAIASQLNGDTAQGSDKLYLKGLGASRVKVHIPFLEKKPDSLKWAVNRAEVIFYVDPDFINSLPSDVTVANYRVPPMLALLAIDSIGREVFTLDQRSGTYISRYNGNYDSDNKRYVFNIPLHAQAILRGTQKNYGFYLVVADPVPPATIRRDNFMEAVILSGSNKTLKPVFNISYVQL